MNISPEQYAFSQMLMGTFEISTIAINGLHEHIEEFLSALKRSIQTEQKILEDLENQDKFEDVPQSERMRVVASFESLDILRKNLYKRLAENENIALSVSHLHDDYRRLYKNVRSMKEYQEIIDFPIRGDNSEKIQALTMLMTEAHENIVRMHSVIITAKENIDSLQGISNFNLKERLNTYILVQRQIFEEHVDNENEMSKICYELPAIQLMKIKQENVGV